MQHDHAGQPATTIADKLLLTFLSFDTDLFHFKCGKLEVLEASVTQTELRSVMAAARQAAYQHIVVKIPAEWVQVAHQLENHGFRFMLSTVCLTKNIANKGDLPTGVCLGSEQDLNRLLVISQEAFSEGTRFFLDPMYARDRVQTLYQRWVTEEIIKNKATILIHQHHGELTGFATLAHGGNLGENGRVGFFAVARRFRQQGIGNRLLAGLEWHGWSDLRQITATTENINYGALKSYGRNGFFATGLWNVFHWHAEG